MNLNTISTNKSRIVWLDYAKVLGIFLIVLGHNIPNWENDILAIYIYSFHVPFFFILSGYLYKKCSIEFNLQKLLKGLLIPYLILTSLGYLLDYFIRDLSVDDFLTYIKNLLAGNPDGFSNPMWFVACLICVKFIDAINDLVSRIIPNYVIPIIVFLINICIYLHNSSLHVPLIINRTLIAYIFYYSGRYIHHYGLISKCPPAFAIMALILPLIISNGLCDLWSCRFGRSFVLYWTYAEVLSISLMVIVRKCCKKATTVITNYALGTMIIVVFHKHFLRTLFSSFNSNLIFCALGAVLTMSLLYIPICLSVKYLPCIIGKKK